MTNVSASMDELFQLARRFDAAGVEVTQAASAAMRKTALDIVATAQQLAAVDTGAMRASISASGPGGAPLGLDALEAEIGPTVSYAPYVEFGTSRAAPQPFMGPAADRHGGTLETALGEIGDRTLG